MSDTSDNAVTTKDWLELQQLAHREFERRLATVSDWSGPTPDNDWNTAQLVRHVIEEQQWVPHLLTGRTFAEAQLAKRPLEDDLTAEWRKYSSAAVAAWEGIDPETSVHLPRDTISALSYLRELVSDVTIHTWDLARATGADDTLDPSLIEAVWTVFEPQKDALVASGLYGAPVPLGDTAPMQSQLLALTGRDDGTR